MSLFGKLKSNLSHGGIKIELVAPEVATQTDTTIPVQVTIAAGDQPQTINSVTVTLETHYFSNSSPTNTTAQPPSDAVISKVESTTPFSLAAGQMSNFTVNLPVSAQSDNPALQAAGSVVEGLSKLSSLSGGPQYQHYVCVKADVVGIALDPQAQQRIRLDGDEQSSIQFNIS